MHENRHLFLFLIKVNNMHCIRHILPIPRTCIWRRCGRCGGCSVSWHCKRHLLNTSAGNWTKELTAGGGRYSMRHTDKTETTNYHQLRAPRIWDLSKDFAIWIFVTLTLLQHIVPC